MSTSSAVIPLGNITYSFKAAVYAHITHHKQKSNLTFLLEKKIRPIWLLMINDSPSTQRRKLVN